MKSNKKRKTRVLATALSVVIFIAVCFLAVAWISHNKIILNYRDLGIPCAELFNDEQLNSRLSEDMIVFDGRLYVGGGDYDANTGPVRVASFDLHSKSWEISDLALPDEQIKRFRVLDGKLIILGTDPKEDWELGNYYLLKDGTFETLRVLKGGIHCFDAIEYNEELFFGLGVNAGGSPVVRYDGESYTSIDFFKDGAKLDTSAHEIIRVYNLFEFKNELFAFLTLDKKSESCETEGHFMELYAYNGSAFEFASGTLPSEDMKDIVKKGESLFMIMNDTLLSTSDLQSFFAVELGGAKAADIINYGGNLYLLAWEKAAFNLFKISVFEEKSGGFEKLFSVYEKAPACSFCKDGVTFYVSLGSRELQTPDMGKVIAVK